MGRSAPRVGPQHNHAESALRGLRAPWPDGHYYTGRTACGPYATGFECSGNGVSNSVLPTCCCVAAVELGWAVLGGLRPALGHNLRQADTPRGEKRAGRAPPDSRAEATAVQTPCFKPAAVLVRSSSDGRRGEEVTPGWATTQPRRVRTCACSVGGRSILHRAKSALAARRRIQVRKHGHSKPVPPTCGGNGAVEIGWTAWGGARTALGHNTTTSSPHCAAFVLRWMSADNPRDETRAGHAPREPIAAISSF